MGHMETVPLAQRTFAEGSDGTPLILLHGLLGSSRNWQTAGRLLEKAYPVTALDLRNHGESPHDSRMDYPVMAADVLYWMDLQKIERAHLLGHSMGGKVAMYLVTHYPDRFRSLTVVDIAPRAYPPRWEREFSVMRRMPVGDFNRRSEAEEWLEPEISDWAFRKFLVTNLERDAEGGFRWIVNLKTLQDALPNLFKQVPEAGDRYDGPALFMRGERSRFVEEKDYPMMQEFFPSAVLETIDGAGHNVHFDQPQAFAACLLQHLKEADA